MGTVEIGVCAEIEIVVLLMVEYCINSLCARYCYRAGRKSGMDVLLDEGKAVLYSVCVQHNSSQRISAFHKGRQCLYDSRLCGRTVLEPGVR